MDAASHGNYLHDVDVARTMNEHASAHRHIGGLGLLADESRESLHVFSPENPTCRKTHHCGAMPSGCRAIGLPSDESPMRVVLSCLQH